ncbi:hypothetical protein [Rhizobium vallis]|uniref:hypothetical protein n=1 Tax=Rhizobium vallis TaxID=634290 RepID=UPI000F860DC2|nr:hypothetical protein [Rhizobium vallis]
MNVISSPAVDEAASASVSSDRASRTGRMFDVGKVVVLLFRQQLSISIDGRGVTAIFFCASDLEDKAPIPARLMQRHRLVGVASRP